MSLEINSISAMSYWSLTDSVSPWKDSFTDESAICARILSIMFERFLALLFPSWEFFDRAGPSLQLEKLTEQGWEDCLKRPSRPTPLQKSWNHYLYRYSQLEGFARAWSEARVGAGEGADREFLEALAEIFDFSKARAIRLRWGTEDSVDFPLDRKVENR